MDLAGEPQGQRRFNEAPALRGGNPTPEALMPANIEASMRPPHCAGEIWLVVQSRYRYNLASMRPPHCAGEIAMAKRSISLMAALQ